MRILSQDPKTNPRVALLLASLTLLATLSAAPAASAEKSCGEHTDADTRDCTFTCDEKDVVTIQVQSDDKTETASGSADCGDAHPQCSGKGSCVASENAGASTIAKSNNCHGQTRDEWYFPNGGFHYSCEAKERTADPPAPSGPLCTLTGNPVVCDVENSLAVIPEVATSSISVSVIRGVAHGEVCIRDQPCRVITPFCWVNAVTEGVSCDTQPGFVPPGAKLLPVK